MASSAGAYGVHRAVSISVGALAIRTTSSALGITHKQGRALAHRAPGSDFADGRGVAGSGRTASLLGAGHLGKRIATESGRAMAHRSVVIGQANGVLTAGLLVADIEAGMGHSVAHLAGRTVVVVDARDTLAAVEGIVRIPGKRSWRALALRLMVVGDAHGAGSTLDRIAGWSAA